MIGVAISTTGDEHRLDALARSVAAWSMALAQRVGPVGPDGWDSTGIPIFVTVDGDEAALARVADRIGHRPITILRVGQPTGFWDCALGMREGRLGVAVNKNTGLEAMMDAGVEHLFLSDDDTWPIFGKSLDKHIEFRQPHSMVCWGKSRLSEAYSQKPYAVWTWPRGVMLYTHRSVVEAVGGMDERFGPGGHEHAEWSRRIHQAGYTASPFITPASYATRGGKGAAALWHCEDMARPGEAHGDLGVRRRRSTSVRRRDGDWAHIEKIMAERDGDTSFVEYRAHANGRESATMSENLTSRAVCAEEPTGTRSEK